MVVTLDQQYHVGEKSTVILYTHINRDAGTPNKTKTKDTMSLDYSSIYYIGSRIGWVSMKGIYKSWMNGRNDSGKLSNNYFYGTYLQIATIVYGRN